MTRSSMTAMKTVRALFGGVVPMLTAATADDKPSKEVVMYQVCKVCQLAQDAALLCRQCGCSLADVR